MKNIWNCTIETVAQQDLDDLFIGGIPKLPPELSIPTCTLCSQKMSFMFQVAFPKGHIWEGKTLALFYVWIVLDISSAFLRYLQVLPFIMWKFPMAFLIPIREILE